MGLPDQSRGTSRRSRAGDGVRARRGRAARTLFESGKYEKVLERYEQTSPDYHLLRVQPAFLQDK
jgi:hypothetical protein